MSNEDRILRKELELVTKFMQEHLRPHTHFVVALVAPDPLPDRPDSHSFCCATSRENPADASHIAEKAAAVFVTKTPTGVTFHEPRKVQ